MVPELQPEPKQRDKDDNGDTRGHLNRVATPPLFRPCPLRVSKLRSRLGRRLQCALVQYNCTIVDVEDPAEDLNMIPFTEKFHPWWKGL